MECDSINSVDVDDKDLAILRELRRDGKAKTGTLAKRTGIPTTTVHNRIKRMEEVGIIDRYVPILHHGALGFDIQACIFVTAEGGQAPDQEALAQASLKLPGVERASILTGGYDLMLSVRVRDVAALEHLLIHGLRPLAGIDKTQTMLVLKEFDGEIDLS